MTRAESKHRVLRVRLWLRQLPAGPASLVIIIIFHIGLKSRDARSSVRRRGRVHIVPEVRIQPMRKQVLKFGNSEVSHTLLDAHIGCEGHK